jgi:hypothetical protein
MGWDGGRMGCGGGRRGKVVERLLLQVIAVKRVVEMMDVPVFPRKDS